MAVKVRLSVRIKRCEVIECDLAAEFDRRAECRRRGERIRRGPTCCGRVERCEHDPQDDRSTTGPAPPEQYRPEVPAAERVPLELMPAREHSSDVLFTSLGERPECVWVSHEDIVRPV
jgi:hypothetical protein